MYGLVVTGLHFIGVQFVFVAVGILGVQSAGKGLDGEWQFVLMRILYFMPFYVLGIWYRDGWRNVKSVIPYLCGL